MTNGEELCVVVVQSHPLDLLTVSLDLESLEHTLVGSGVVPEDLDGSRSVWL